jgi:hypothetical protein
MQGTLGSSSVGAIGRNKTAGVPGRVVGGMSVPCEGTHF